MGYVKEPEGIYFTVDPTPLTTEDRKKLSDIIAHYKATGKKISLQNLTTQPRRKKPYTLLSSRTINSNNK